MFENAWYATWDAEAAGAEAVEFGDRSLIPEGRHNLRILKAEAGDERVAIRLAHSDRRFGFLFADFNRSSKYTMPRLRQMAEVMGMSLPDWAAALERGELVGRYVRCDVRPWVNEKTGKVKAVVRQFLPEDQADPFPSPASPSSSTGSSTSSGGGADIPF